MAEWLTVHAREGLSAVFSLSGDGSGREPGESGLSEGEAAGRGRGSDEVEEEEAAEGRDEEPMRESPDQAELVIRRKKKYCRRVSMVGRLPQRARTEGEESVGGAQKKVIDDASTGWLPFSKTLLHVLARENQRLWRKYSSMARQYILADEGESTGQLSEDLAYMSSDVPLPFHLPALRELSSSQGTPEDFAVAMQRQFWSPAGELQRIRSSVTRPLAVLGANGSEIIVK